MMRLLQFVLVASLSTAVLAACGSSQHPRQSASGGQVTTRSARPDRLDHERRIPPPNPSAHTTPSKVGGGVLSQVQHAYRHVPGVELTATAQAKAVETRTRRFLLVMHDGSVSAEEFVDPGRHGFQLVARTNGPTFMHTTGTACWRPLHHSTKRWVLRLLNTRTGSLGRLEQSDPRTLLNVGSGFPDVGKALPLGDKTGGREVEIETHDAFWYLAGTANPPRLAPKSFLTITPNPRSHRITAIQVRAPERSVDTTLSVKTLTASPAIPRPTPTC